jgi:hypothetical protein
MIKLATYDAVRLHIDVRGGNVFHKILVAVDGLQQSDAALAVAVEDRCDLIVMGSRGHGQLAGLLLHCPGRGLHTPAFVLPHSTAVSKKREPVECWPQKACTIDTCSILLPIAL